MKLMTDIHDFAPDGTKVHPYQGVRGAKKGKYSVNFTNDTKKFQAMDEAQLIATIESGRFRERGIRMIAAGAEPGAQRNAFAPLAFRGKAIR